MTGVDMKVLDKLMESDLPEVEKLAQGFEMITKFYIETYQNQADLLSAVQDRDGLVREQIKLESMKFTRGIFADCYRRATGRSFRHG
jgi:hypothetical protein